MSNLLDVDEATVGYLVSRVTEALGEQAELHLELAKAEVARDARALVKDILPFAVAVPLVSVGYLLACVAAGLALAPWLGYAGGFALLAALNLLGGGLTIRKGMLQLRSRRGLTAVTGAELGESARGLVAAVRPSHTQIEAQHAR
ncbi:MAG: phage holin family protein [Pseudomonadota bacterium]|nr:phage holin family protein [Pseudomonadota bacterium]